MAGNFLSVNMEIDHESLADNIMRICNEIQYEQREHPKCGTKELKMIQNTPYLII